MDRTRRSVSPPGPFVTALDEKRLRERHLFRTINKCLLGSILVGGFFAVIAASGGMKSQGQTLDRTGSALGVMAMFLGVSLALTIVLVVRFALRERRLGTRRAKSPLKPSNV